MSQAQVARIEKRGYDAYTLSTLRRYVRALGDGFSLHVAIRATPRKGQAATTTFGYEMKNKTMTPEQVRVHGLAALEDALGPVGMIRFLRQIEAGYGDYGTDRHTWLEETDVKTLAEKIRQRRKKSNTR